MQKGNTMVSERFTAVQGAMCIAMLVLAVLSGELLATITTVGSVDPPYDDTDPWLIGIGDEFIVGFEADGSLSITAGSDVTSSCPTYIGDYAWEAEGTTGALLLTGLGSTFTVDLAGESEFYVGPFATGYLTVTDQAILSTHDAIIGGSPAESDSNEVTAVVDGEGYAVVSGGAQWSTGDEGWLTVGAAGSGELTITGTGSLVTGDTGEIGLMPDAVGNVLVEESGSWTLTGDLIVGVWGDGSLTVSGGGQVQSSRSWVGGVDAETVDYNEPVFEGLGEPNGTGTVVVTGTGSQWDAGSLLAVGSWGTGEISIQNGGQVSAGTVIIGGGMVQLEEGQEFTEDLVPDGTGMITVTGSGSRLDATGEDTLFVGYSSDGVLDVNEGGLVTSGSMIVGAAPDVIGTVTVHDTGSLVAVEDEVLIGAWGEGHLTIYDGGEVQTRNLVVGGFEPNDTGLDPAVEAAFGDPIGSGYVEVTGSSLDVNGVAQIGYSGDAYVSVTDGGTVDTSQTVLGVAPGSYGEITVDGTDSQWSVSYSEEFDNETGLYSGVMVVGGYGQGDLTVSNGGSVDIDDVVFVGGYPAEEIDYDANAVGYDPEGAGTVTVTGNGSLLETDGLVVGHSGDGTLNVASGGDVINTESWLGVAPEGSGEALVNGDGSTWTHTGSMVVGAYGEGELTVSGGGQVSIGQILFVGGFATDQFDEEASEFGDNPTGTGTVTVTGDGSVLEAYAIGVGIGGDGTLAILDGGLVESQIGVVGADEGGVGAVLVDGEGSTWTLSGDNIPLDGPNMEGEGDLVVSNGGLVEVTDPNAALLVADSITVGSEGEGTLTVSGGGLASAGSMVIGGTNPEFDSVADYLDPNAGLGTGTGTVAISGAGSTLTLEEQLFVGFSGNGDLTISEGAQVTDGGSLIGVMPDVVGTALVIGQDSTWANGGPLVVGAWGEGSLTIADGAQVTASEVYIGGLSFDVLDEDYDADLVPDGTGSVLVTGTGSVLNATGDDTLYVGYSGTGTLDVNDGGSVTAQGIIIGAGPDITGTVTVADAGSSLEAAGTMIVGLWGQGELAISAGAQVTADSLYIGGFDASEIDLDPNMLAEFGDVDGTGRVTVSGTDSLLRVAGDDTLFVGYSGEGTLDVNDGGQIIAENVVVGATPDGVGTVTVTDADSLLQVDEELIVGAWGEGDLTISDGGQVTAETLFVGGFDVNEADFDPNVLAEFGDVDGPGAVTVTGADSTLVVDTLALGFSGEGDLWIANDANVTTDGALLGITPDAHGEIVVTGAGSSWVNTTSAVVGADGAGLVTVQDGGRVDINDVLFVGGYDPNEFSGELPEYAYDTDGAGTVVVAGAGSSLEADEIVLGAVGHGTLEVIYGGEVQTGAVVLGVGEAGFGRISVDGEGSLLQITGDADVSDVQLEGTGEVTVSNGGAIVVDEPNAYLGVAGEMTIGSEGTGSSLTISDGGFVYAGYAVLGGVDLHADFEYYFNPDANLSDGEGSVTVTGEGSSWEAGDLVVGFSGDGTLSVEDGGRVWDGTAIVGLLPDATGTVDVSGPNAVWDSVEGLVVGAWGTGHLTISDGGEVWSPEVFIGGMPLEMIGDDIDPDYTPTGTGVVTVTGAGSALEVWEAASLYVGYSGTGVLDVNDGGYVESLSAGIGAMPDSNGVAVITDPNSEWNNIGSMFVGGYGTGHLTILNGGEVHIGDTLYLGGFDAESESFDTVDGVDPNGVGYVTVSGEGSRLEVGGEETLHVGYSGAGMLGITDAGAVESQTSYVGTTEDGVGWVTVDEDGTWTISGTLYVAYAGLGGVIISDGGQAESEEATIAYEEDSIGLVSVRGSGSTWTASEQSIGRSGTGYLLISDGGVSTTTSAILGQMMDGHGQAFVAGTESQWGISNTLWVGYRGEGELAISDGGSVTSTYGYIGYETNSTGAVTVTGTESLWVLDDDLYVGYAGTGTLDVNDNARVIVDDNLYIGGDSEGSGGTGVLTVRDTGEVIVADELYVWETGTLAGDGTVTISAPTTLYNYGTIAPGNDGIGTLTVNGSVVFEPNSIFSVQIGDANESDKLVVHGDVTIEGGTVQVDSVGTIMGTHEYDILSADSIVGEFNDLDTALLDFSFSDIGLDYNDTGIQLYVTATDFDDPNIARTYNQRQVGGALQEIGNASGNEVTKAVQALETGGEVRNAYDQLSGQTRTALAPTTLASSSKFLGMVTSRVQTLRTGLMAGAFDSSLLAAGGPDRSAATPAQDAATRGQTFAVGNGSTTLADQRWGMWGRTYRLFGDRDSGEGVPAYDYDAFGGSFGVDYQWTENLLAGIVGGMAEGEISFEGSRDNTDFDAAYIGLYGSYAHGPWAFDSVATYSSLDYDTERFVDVMSEQLTGSFDGSEFAAYVEASRTYDLSPRLRLAPLASLQYSHLKVDSYTETGGDSALSFEEQKQESVRGSLGARLTRSIIESTGDFRADVQLRGRWVHEFGDTRSSVDTSFASDPTVVFDVRDEDVSRDSAVLGVGLAAKLNKQTRAYVDYDTRLNSDETVQVISASLQYRW